MRQITCADNIDAMSRLPDGGVDLVYMDPPFNSGRMYGMQHSERKIDGRDSVAPAFSDANWSTGSSDDTPSEIIGSRSALRVSRILEAVPQQGLRGYLQMMVPRLIHAWRVLNSTGSLFVHCDPTRQPLPKGCVGRGLRARKVPERDRLDEYVVGVFANHWDEVTASVQSAEQRFLTARESVRQAEETLDAWVDDAELYVALGRDRHRRGVLARQSALDVARRALYDLDDPGLPDDGTVLWVDGRTYPYELWGDDRDRDRRVLRGVIAEVSLGKADPRRRRWQPIDERVGIRWVGADTT